MGTKGRRGSGKSVPAASQDDEVHMTMGQILPVEDMGTIRNPFIEWRDIMKRTTNN